MQILDKINQYFLNLKNYLNAEVDLIKVQLLKKVGGFMGMAFSALFIIVLFHITMALAGIWLGFWLGELLDSTTLGFGVTVLIYILWLILSVVFRRTLLIKPFTKLIISTIIEEEELEEEKEHPDEK